MSNSPSESASTTPSSAADASITSASWTPYAVIGLPFAVVVSFVAFGVNAEQLLLGWLYFPLQTVPQMTIDWASAIVGIISFLLLVFTLHRIAGWFSGRRWTIRSTILATCTLSLLFIAGTALVGASHQVVWLFSGRNSQMAVTEYPGLLFGARDSARQIQCRNNLKQLGLGFHNYHDSFQTFPPGGTINVDGELLHGWALALGPYVGYMAPEDMNLQQSWKAAANAKTYQCQMSYFVNPSQEGALFDDEGFGLCHFAGNIHVLPIRTVSADESSKQSWSALYGGIAMKDITDGTANTLLIGTVGQNFKPWGHPANVRDPALGINRSPDSFGGPPTWRGAQFAMCDGSVRFFSEDTDPSIMAALGTIAGGEHIEDGQP